MNAALRRTELSRSDLLQDRWSMEPIGSLLPRARALTVTAPVAPIIRVRETAETVRLQDSSCPRSLPLVASGNRASVARAPPTGSMNTSTSNTSASRAGDELDDIRAALSPQKCCPGSFDGVDRKINGGLRLRLAWPDIGRAVRKVSTTS
jgi:hypothetical protein